MSVQDAMAQLRHLQVERAGSFLRFERMAATTPDAMIIADETGRIVSWNASAEVVFGYAEAEALRMNMRSLLTRVERHGEDFASHCERFVGSINEVAAHRRDGALLTVECSLSRWTEGERLFYGIVVRDVSERKALESRLDYLAHRDQLTGLSNRTAFLSRFREALATGQPAAVLLVDLDGFKEVNNKLGHDAADEALRVASLRVADCVARSYVVARLGGDEFAVLIPDCMNATQAQAVSGQIIEAVSRPMEVHNQSVMISASVGLALSASRTDQPDELLSSAELALTQAKADGRGCCRVFVPSMREAFLTQRRFTQEIRRAAENEEFRVFFQPQFCMKTGALTGAEALIRWQHPVHGLLQPSAFLSSLMSSRHARQVSDWVLEVSCRQAVRWRGMGFPDFRVAVNLCKTQLRADDLVTQVLGVLERTGLPPSGLELELTEDLMLGREDHDIAPLRTLRKLGVGFALDDYGTGYASLAVLKNYPLTRLKVDRCFVREMEGTEDATIIRAIINLAKGFDLQVTAEGIETESQLARLRKKGCHSAQGYLFGRPVPPDEFEAAFVQAAPRRSATG